MREILFKAKRIDNGEWVEGNLVYSPKADDEYKAIIIPSHNNNMYTSDYNNDVGFECWYKVRPETICQYTGLTDKNGVKIWENDVVRYKDDIINKEKIDLIEYNETRASFIRLHKSQMGLQYLYINEAIAGKSEVIGNIFDNPELLEVVE